MTDEHLDTAELQRAARIARLETEVRLSGSIFVRGACIVLGTLCVGVGVPGLVFPVVPGTPFLLLAAFFYSIGSKKFFIWLLTNKLFGDYVYGWWHSHGIPMHIKIKVTALLVVSFAVTIFFLMPPILPAKITMVVIGTGVIIYIWSQPTTTEPVPEHIHPRADETPTEHE